MLEPDPVLPDGVQRAAPVQPYPPHTERRAAGWRGGYPERRHGPSERRQRPRALDYHGRRRGLPDRRRQGRRSAVPLPPFPVGQDLLPLVSHELRTPLTSIQGYAQLLARRLRQRGAGDDLLGPTNAIGAQARRLGALVDELLVLSELAYPAPRLQSHRLDVAPIVADAVAAMQAQARRHRIVLQAASPLLVRGDAERLRQLVDELLCNAVKYSPDGGEIQVRCWATDQGVRLDVVDHGTGIAPEHIPRIFDPFVQATPGGGSGCGGLGLGLALCQAIVIRHGGRIGVTSVPGQGSTFSVQFPPADG